MRPLWMIQVNMGSSKDVARLVETVRGSGADVAEVSAVPFSDEVPDINGDRPVIAYGAEGFVEASRRSGRWLPCAFGDRDVFAYRNWAEHYGSLLLNSPDSVSLTTVREFSVSTGQREVFVRPIVDAKLIVGGIRDSAEFRAWCATASSGMFEGVDGDTAILIGQPYGIEAEWRLFVSGLDVVGASEYQRQGRPSRRCGAPESILDFGRHAASLWSPAPLYTLDVCLSAGNPYVVEAQGFNSSGLYEAYLPPVAEAANRAAMTMWQAKHLLPSP